MSQRPRIYDELEPRTSAPQVNWDSGSSSEFISFPGSSALRSLAESQARVVAMLAAPSRPRQRPAGVRPRMAIRAKMLGIFEDWTGYTIEFYNPFAGCVRAFRSWPNRFRTAKLIGAAGLLSLSASGAYLAGLLPNMRSAISEAPTLSIQTAAAAEIPDGIAAQRIVKAHTPHLKPENRQPSTTGKNSVFAFSAAPRLPFPPSNVAAGTASAEIMARLGLGTVPQLTKTEPQPVPLNHADPRWPACAPALAGQIVPFSLALSTDDYLPLIETGVALPVPAERPKARPSISMVTKAKLTKEVPSRIKLASSPSAWVKATVNMRTGPYNRTKSIAVVPARASVRVLRCNIWCKVAWNGKRGFVHRKFVNTRS